MKKVVNKQNICFVLGIVAFIIVGYCITPPPELTHKSMICLGSFVWAVFQWVGGTCPVLATWMIMFGIWIVSGATTMGVAASGFSSNMIPFIVGAMGISAALNATGLLKRIVFSIMKLFSPTFKGQTVGMLVMNTIVNFMIPSAAAKAALIPPIASGISDGMGFKDRSRGQAGMAISAYIGCCVLGPVYFNANFFTISVRAALPAETQAQFGMVNWLIAALPWYLLTFAFWALYVNTIHRPLPGETTVNKEYVLNELQSMGKMKGKEYFALAVLVISAVLWALENKINISSGAVAIAAIGVLLIFKICTVKDFVHGTVWDIVLIIGTTTGMGNVFRDLGIFDWTARVMTPLINMVADKKILVIIMMIIVVYLVRLLIVSQLVAIPLCMNIFLPVCALTGINPWIFGFLTVCSSQVWAFLYQNTLGMQLLAGFGGDERFDFKVMTKAGIVFMVVNIVFICLCVPYWSMFGYMG